MSSITVYTTTSCAYCTMVKKYLTAKNFEFREVKVDTDTKRQRVTILSGGSSLPVTVIREGRKKDVLIGWKPRELSAALLKIDPVLGTI